MNILFFKIFCNYLFVIFAEANTIRIVPKNVRFPDDPLPLSVVGRQLPGCISVARHKGFHITGNSNSAENVILS